MYLPTWPWLCCSINIGDSSRPCFYYSKHNFLSPSPPQNASQRCIVNSSNMIFGLVGVFVELIYTHICIYFFGGLAVSWEPWAVSLRVSASGFAVYWVFLFSIGVYAHCHTHTHTHAHRARTHCPKITLTQTRAASQLLCVQPLKHFIKTTHGTQAQFCAGLGVETPQPFPQTTKNKKKSSKAIEQQPVVRLQYRRGSFQ